MRRLLSLLPLLLIVLAAPGVAEAQSFCSLSGVEWTRCYDFSTGANGFSPVNEGGTLLGDYSAGWNSVEWLIDPGDPGLRQHVVSLNSPSGWTGAAITQLKLVYQWTPGSNEDIGEPWASVFSGSAATWSRADLVAGSGTITKSVAITAANTIRVTMYGAQCMSCSTPGSVTGSITLVGLVIGGTGTPPPGDEPSGEPTSEPPGDGETSTGITVDTGQLLGSIGGYVTTFQALFVIPLGIAIAIVVLVLIGKVITSAIKRGGAG